MATDITPDPAVALDAASLAALENTTVTVGAALPAGANAIGTVTAVQATAANLKVDASGVAVPVTDNGGSLTVDGAVTVSGTATVSGTVTANAGTNLNTSALATEAGNLAGILTAVQVIDNIVAGSEAQVDIVAALPAGTNNIGDVDVLSLPAIPAGTNNIGDVDVLTLPALPAGTNAIGKLVANSGVDIGDVDVTSMPGTGVEDAAETAGGTLLMAGTVRRDAPASSAGTTGDNATLNTDALGHVWVALPAIVRISQIPTVSTSPAYTAKDAVGGLLTFVNAVRVSAGSGILVAVTVIDLGITPSSLELMLFNQTFTASSDNAIYDPTDADLANALPSVAINSWQIFSDNSLGSVSGLSIPIVLTGTSLFGQLRTLGTPTYAGTSDIAVMIEVIQN